MYRCISLVVAAMEDEWYSGDTTAGGTVGGAIATGGASVPVGSTSAAATTGRGYGDSFTPPHAHHKGMLVGQVRSRCSIARAPSKAFFFREARVVCFTTAMKIYGVYNYLM